MAKDRKPSKRLGTVKITPKENEAELEQISAKAKSLEQQTIDLNAEQRDELARWLDTRISAARKSRVWTDTKTRILQNREYYEHGVPRTEIAMPGAHDYRTMVAATQTDGM